ncbi:peptidase [Mycobacterium sp.]|uniref:peptidase n=1 Tax=Mycobacterium sp. TaxID=1785 RepID=UPI002C78D5BF|nr:peptidase [Mycobacterium sp.]HKP44268.1 peptidase [Mycobacterium sp.]
MRRSTTSAGTKRRSLLGLLIAELIFGAVLLARPPATNPPSPSVAAPPSLTTATAASTTETLSDGRTVHLVGLGGTDTAPVLARIAAEMDSAARAVTEFWGPNWPRDVLIVAAGSDTQFRQLAGGSADIAATTTAERIMFAPGAAAMSDAALRIVVRHELFHYAARADTAADAPSWLTEGVADYVGRPPTPRPANAADLASIPTDADLGTAGPDRSLAYDRAWWFSRFVAEEYGTSTLRALYLRACGNGHPDAATAVHDTLGADLPTVLIRWRAWLTG